MTMKRENLCQTGVKKNQSRVVFQSFQQVHLLFCYIYIFLCLKAGHTKQPELFRSPKIGSLPVSTGLQSSNKVKAEQRQEIKSNFLLLCKTDINFQYKKYYSMMLHPLKVRNLKGWNITSFVWNRISFKRLKSDV